MSTWSDLGFPCVNAGGYGYGLDLGIARPAVDSAIPDQKVTWVEPLKTFNVSCTVPPEMLSEIEAFFVTEAYDWFTMPLVSGADVGLVDHTVRAIGPYSLSYQSPTVWTLQFQVEAKKPPIARVTQFIPEETRKYTGAQAVSQFIVFEVRQSDEYTP